MIKMLCFIILWLSLVEGISAQSQSSQWLGLHTAILRGKLFSFDGQIGASETSGASGFLVGIGYIKSISVNCDIETGIDYSQRFLKITYVDDPNIDIENYNPEYFGLITIPVNVRLKLKHRFFISYGILIEQRINAKESSSFDNQSGIGMNIKFGKDFKISDKHSINIAPEILIHGIIPIPYQKFAKRLTEIGLRISYNFRL
jgi:hypothetical protein